MPKQRSNFELEQFKYAESKSAAAAAAAFDLRKTFTLPLPPKKSSLPLKNPEKQKESSVARTSSRIVSKSIKRNSRVENNNRHSNSSFKFLNSNESKENANNNKSSKDKLTLVSEHLKAEKNDSGNSNTEKTTSTAIKKQSNVNTTNISALLKQNKIDSDNQNYERFDSANNTATGSLEELLTTRNFLQQSSKENSEPQGNIAAISIQRSEFLNFVEEKSGNSKIKNESVAALMSEKKALTKSNVNDFENGMNVAIRKVNMNVLKKSVIEEKKTPFHRVRNSNASAAASLTVTSKSNLPNRTKTARQAKISNINKNDSIIGNAQIKEPKSTKISPDNLNDFKDLNVKKSKNSVQDFKILDAEEMTKKEIFNNIDDGQEIENYDKCNFFFNLLFILDLF